MAVVEVEGETGAGDRGGDDGDTGSEEGGGSVLRFLRCLRKVGTTE